MKSQNGFVISEGLIALVLLVVFIGGLCMFFKWHESSVDRKCKVQFGQEWVGKVVSYTPDMCINKNGEAKYPL